jgi:hypothetical protein
MADSKPAGSKSMIKSRSDTDVEPAVDKDDSTEMPLGSPFALMSADATRAIVQRASALDLPSRRCSPLSQRSGGAAGADDDDDDF